MIFWKCGNFTHFHNLHEKRPMSKDFQLKNLAALYLIAKDFFVKIPYAHILGYPPPPHWFSCSDNYSGVVVYYNNFLYFILLTLKYEVNLLKGPVSRVLHQHSHIILTATGMQHVNIFSYCITLTCILLRKKHACMCRLGNKHVRTRGIFCNFW